MGFFDIFKREDKPHYTSKIPKGKRTLDASKVDRFTGGWTGTLTGPNNYLRSDLNVIRARSREAVRNSEYARRALNMYHTNLIGEKGITLQNQSRNRNGQLDRPAIQAIEQAWKNWGRARNCDITKRFTFRDIQRQVVSSLFIDGEAFIRVYRGSSASERYKFALQVIDPALIDPKYNVDKARNGNKIRSGIEYDSMGRAVAYHITQTGNHPYIYSYNGVSYLRVPAEDILHIFMPDNPDQRRGLPLQTAGLYSLHQIHEYKKTALIAARAGASAMVFITSEDNSDSVAADEVYDEDDEESPTILEFSPMTFQELPSGSDLKTYDTNYPTGEYVEFIKSHLQAYASAVNVSYALLTGDLEGVNFSSLKNANAHEKDSFKALQQFLVDHFLDPIYEMWLRQQLINGTITIGGTPLDPTRLEKYLASDWSAPRWAPIDEQKKANADRIRLEDGTTTISAILAEEGREFSDVMEQRKAEMDKLKELGLEFTEKKVTDPAEVEDGTDS